MNKKLKKVGIILVVGLVVGLFLLPAGNLWAGMIDSGTTHLKYPSDWDVPPPIEALLDDIIIDWAVYERTDTDFVPSYITNVADSANYVTTWKLSNVSAVLGYGISVITFRNVALEPYDSANPSASVASPGNPGSVGVYDDSPPINMGVGVMNDDPLGGALVFFYMSPPVRGGMASDTGWLASEINPADTLNSTMEISVFGFDAGETTKVEVCSIFADTGSGTTDLPEPATLLLLGSGLLLSGILRRRIVA